VLIAASTTKSGRRLLIVGLQDENLYRLRNDEPIYRSLDDVPGLEEWDLSILGPEDMERFIAATKGATER
jgi:hypothetical protein